ncbi:MAG TPA: glycosyltransferase family 4 protein [Solirubrobacteraceae bacterium]|jgi:glycosyltransferase involved in cell wall biosynthesis
MNTSRLETHINRDHRRLAKAGAAHGIRSATETSRTMLRCAIVPPVPVPYREPLFQRLAARPEIALRVVYQASSQASWDQAAGWFPAEHGYDAVHLKARHIARRGRSPITWARGLERALADFDPDVVVVSEFGPATLRALAWCRRRRRALVVLTEVTAAAELTLSQPQRRLHRWLAGRVDGFVAVSGAARDRLLALGADPEAVTVSLQPVDEDALIAARQARHPLDATSVETSVEVLTVARLVPDKDVGGLIQAFAQAGLSPAEATLSVVGGGPLEDELRSQAQALGVGAHFFGAVPASELPARYASAGVFALTSRYEPFGVALREAVVAGLPVICSTAVGATGDFAHADANVHTDANAHADASADAGASTHAGASVDAGASADAGASVDAGANALLVAPGDVDALARALARLCRDTELRRALGAASRRIASENTLAADVDAFASMLSRAARAARVRR